MRKKRRAMVIVRHAQGKEGASSYLVSAIFFRALGKQRGISKQPNPERSTAARPLDRTIDMKGSRRHSKKWGEA